MELPENREATLKELPTRELKLKRNKDRRDSPTVPPIRLRLKSNNSPLNSETDTERCFSDRSISSSPDSVTQELSPIAICNSYGKTSLINSLPSSPTCNETSETFQFAPNSVVTESEDYNQPLDMSRKRSQSNSSVDRQAVHPQIRPSVITCASALLRTQCNLNDLAHHMCNANVTDPNCNEGGEGNHCEEVRTNKGSACVETKAIRPGHRREIVSGSCDPVIDEHFRRSLGKDYTQIFSKSSANSVSITVDDHFAKALGDTWHQLQQSKNADSVSSVHSSSSLQAQPPPPAPQFVHQPPEIVS